MQQAEVLQQVSSLVALRMLEQVRASALVPCFVGVAASVGGTRDWLPVDSCMAWAHPTQASALLPFSCAQVTGDALEGQSYRCNLGDDVATRLADNVRLRLTDYLKLA